MWGRRNTCGQSMQSQEMISLGLVPGLHMAWAHHRTTNLQNTYDMGAENGWEGSEQRVER